MSEVTARRRTRVLGTAKVNKVGAPKGSRNRASGLTVREYERKRKLTRLYELSSLQIPISEIAHIMDESEWWVKDSLKQIQEDFSTLAQTEDAKRIIDENIARFEMLIRKALEMISIPKKTDSGKRIPAGGKAFFDLSNKDRLKAIHEVANLIKAKAEYEVTVGRVKKAPTDLRFRGFTGIGSNLKAPAIEELRGEVSDDDLNAIFLAVADSIRSDESSPLHDQPLELPA